MGKQLLHFRARQAKAPADSLHIDEMDSLRLTTISPLTDFDSTECENLLDLAFGTDRRGRTAYRLREGQRWLPDLSVGATDSKGTLVALLQCWPVSLARAGEADTRMVLVGPVAVDPAHQRLGLGKSMMKHMLAIADARPEYQITMMIGDPEYYGRFFGYDATPASHWDINGPIERRRLLVRKPAAVSLPVRGEILPGWRHRPSTITGQAA